MFPSLPQVIIRQAESRDISTVSRFIDQTILVHRNLDWQPLTEWVPRAPFLIRLEDNKLTSLLSCAPDPEGIAWIHAFAMDYWSSDIQKVWRSLLEPAVDKLKDLQSNLYSVALNDWYSRLLHETGFEVKQNIVVLIWEQSIPPALALRPDILIRPMQSTDLIQVAELDRQAFDSTWTISQESLEHAYLAAAHSSVAEVEDKILGYELSTANHFSAHLTRLAVSPVFKQANVGYSLTREMLIYFNKQGICSITVNTQDDNTASIGLYRKLGFKLNGESFPIYWLEIQP